jgi:hypothetical protein
LEDHTVKSLLSFARLLRKIALISLCVLIFCAYSYAQFQIDGYDPVKKVKLLQTERSEVRQIFWDLKRGEPDFDDEDETAGNTLDNTVSGDRADDEHEDWFSTKNAAMKVTYAFGNCSDDDDIWNVLEWKVTEIEVEPRKPIDIKDIKLDLSKLKKEREFVDKPESFIYHSKETGIAFEVNEEKVRRIFVFPPRKSHVPMCADGNQTERFESASWFGDRKLEDRYSEIVDFAADVKDLILSVPELKFTVGDMETEVETMASDPENDVLTYNYYVSAGKIVGQGHKVVWNLKGVSRGTYSITAGVDDGCGICGKTVTKTVTIK